MANINEILARAAALRDETALNSISPERAGGIMYDTLLALNELWLQQGAALVISKIYASVDAMEADTEPVSDISGKPLRPGQIVVIASVDEDNGSVYRYNGTDSPSWSLVGNIGNLEPVDSLDSDSTNLPLAAHQGKVLDGKISQLGQKVDEIPIVSVSQNTSTGDDSLLGDATELAKFADAGKIVKLMGMGTVSGGNGITAVGQYFYHTTQKKIMRCIKYPMYVLSDCEAVGNFDGAIYTYKDCLYTWNGTDLIQINLYNVLKLAGFAISQADFNIGDYYYNTLTHEIRKKTGGPGVYEIIPYVDGAIYTYNGTLYYWNGTNLTPLKSAGYELLSYDLSQDLTFDFNGGVYCSETPTGQIEFGDLYPGPSNCYSTSAYNNISAGDVLLLALLSRPTGQAGICFYNSSKEPIKGIYLNAANAYNYMYLVAPENAAYFRMTKFDDGVVSEPFLLYVLSLYEKTKYELNEKSFESVWKAINAITPQNFNKSYLDSIESERDATAMSFSFIADSHYNSTNKAKTMQVISDMVTLADYGCVDMGVHLGDVHNGVGVTMDVMKEELTDIARQFYKQKAFCTMLKGNHDDGTWIVTDSTNIISSGIWRNRCMSDYGKLDGYRYNEINPFNNYFYKDFDKYKIRVICLDTLDVPHFLVDGELKYKKTDYGMQEQQLKWLAQKALIIDKNDASDWAVIFLTHVPLKSNGGDGMGLKNYDVFEDIVEGFIAGTSGMAVSILTDFAASVPFDFTSQGQGEVICNFHGHVHNDTYDNSGDFPLIGFLNTASDNAYFDVALVNRQTRKIYTKRYNKTGYDRTWDY